MIQNSITISKYRSELEKLAGTVTLVVGGPPCQGFSMAGQRKNPENDLADDIFEIYLSVASELNADRGVKRDNENFKVLWFEDEMGWRPSSERSMKKIIESHNLVPIITWKKGDEGDAEEELKKEYDLILMDYELRGTMGNILIKKLRQFDIYTDVVFYSGNYNKMVKALYNIDEKGMNIEPVDGIYFSDRKREELFPKLQKVVDKVVRRMQDIVNLRGVVLDNVSGFENQMQNILVLAANKFSQAQIKSLNEYTKNKLIVPAKNEYIRKIDEIESNPEALKAIISAPDYFLDSYKKARLVGRVIKILVDEYGLVIDKKYNKFVEVYYNEIIKYRNALGHAMRSNEHADREVFIGEIDKTPLIFTEDLFRQMRASLNEYQQVINLVENSFNQI